MAKRITTIQPTECIGNSLNTFNTNFTNLQSRLDDVVKKSNEIIEYINDTVLFVPVNFTKNNNPDNAVIRSNDTVVIENEKPKNVNLNAKPWWSKSYQVAVPNRPPRCIGALIQVYFNTNSIKNNGMAFFIKDRNVAPGSDPTPSAKEQARYNLKFTMDPNGPFFEAEQHVVFPIYMDDTDKNGCKPGTFHWRIRDNRALKTNKTPEYTVRIRLLGYYLDVNLKKIA
jgi:hypothetical protein